MTGGSKAVPYAPLPPNPSPFPQNYVVLPLYHPPDHYRRCRLLRRCLLHSSAALLFCAAVFLLWPSDPTIQLVRLHLNRIDVHSSPRLDLDISLSVTLRVRNRDFFSLDYQSLIVAISYRGRRLGFVNSNGGHVRARGTSYVDATLELNGFEILQDVLYLLEDLAKGWLPFDTDTEVRGDVGLFFFKIPLKARVSCEVDVSTKNQTIIRQNCYPE